MTQDWTVSYKYNVPYIAGYNAIGNVIYIDKRVPRKYTKYLLIHELTEQHLENCLELRYAEAHRIATAAEKEAYTNENSDWLKYSAVMNRLAKICRNEFESVPPDLDMDPYIQCKDKELIAKMYEMEPRLKSRSNRMEN